MVCPIGCEKTHHRYGKSDASGTWVPTATNGASSHEVKATLNSGLDHPVESEWCQPDLSSGVSLTSLINNKDFSEIDKNLFLSVDNEEDLLELEAFTVQAIDAALLEELASAEASVDHEAELELIRHPSHRLGMAQAAIALWFDNLKEKKPHAWRGYLRTSIGNDPTAISCEYDGELAIAFIQLSALGIKRPPATYGEISVKRKKISALICSRQRHRLPMRTPPSRPRNT